MDHEALKKKRAMRLEELEAQQELGLEKFKLLPGYFTETSK